ncbi:MAG: hypothetical protein ACRBB2_05435 [Nitrosopumilus sp.]
MNVIAGGSIAIIIGLVAMSLLCIGCSEEIILVEDVGQADPDTNMVLKNSQQIGELRLFSKILQQKY